MYCSHAMPCHAGLVRIQDALCNDTLGACMLQVHMHGRQAGASAGAALLTLTWVAAMDCASSVLRLCTLPGDSAA